MDKETASSKPDILGDTKDVGPARVASGEIPTPPVDTKTAAEAQKTLAERDSNHQAPAINLLPSAEQLDDEHTPKAAAGPVKHERPVKARTSHRKLVLSLLGLVAVVLGAAGAAAYDSLNPGPLVQLQIFPASTPEPSASPSPSVAPSPTPSSTPAPTPAATAEPSPTPAPQTITAPTTAPTTENPQIVTVTAKNGMWLRSSPSSANQSNVIGWIPNGAKVSVDEVGDFWWHGAYKGQSGYFASKYTQ